MKAKLEQVIREYLLAHGYEIQQETENGGIWIKPESANGWPQICSFEWAIRDCLQKEGWFAELNQFLAEQ